MNKKYTPPVMRKIALSSRVNLLTASTEGYPYDPMSLGTSPLDDYVYGFYTDED